MDIYMQVDSSLLQCHVKINLLRRWETRHFCQINVNENGKDITHYSLSTADCTPALSVPRTWGPTWPSLRPGWAAPPSSPCGSVSFTTRSTSSLVRNLSCCYEIERATVSTHTDHLLLQASPSLTAAKYSRGGGTAGLTGPVTDSLTSVLLIVREGWEIIAMLFPISLIAIWGNL